MKSSVIHKRLNPAQVRALTGKLSGMAMDSADKVHALSKIGINISDFVMKNYAQAYGMDAAITVPGLNINTPQAGGVYAQFLQTWLNGQVRVAITPRKADLLMGVTTAGSWEDEELIQEILELVGVAQPYSDFGNIPLSSWKLSYERRGIVRFEEGFQVGELEGLRSGKIGIDSAATKREAAQLALEVARNRVAFFGYQTSTTRPVYGFLNDPNAPAYVNNASGKSWDVATREEQIKDILTGLAQLRKGSKEVIDPKSTPIVLAVASDKVDYLSTPGGTGSNTGETALDWLQKNYPNVTVESVYELNKAVGGKDAFYLYATSVADTGSDGGSVIEQIVQTRLRPLGVDTSIKVVTEDFTNATSGVLVKRPFGMYRASGI
jgi:hypothetical protein